MDLKCVAIYPHIGRFFGRHPTEESLDNPVLKFKCWQSSEALKSIAKSLLGIDLMEVKVAKEKELKRDLTKDEEIELFESEIKKMRNGERDPQIMVSEEELEEHLADGWRFVSVLPSQKILVKRTS